MTGEFNLFCENSHYRDLAISLKFLAIIAGNILFGYISDRFGNSKSINWSWGLGTAGILWIYLAKQYWSLLGGYFICGLCLWPSSNFAIIALNEQSGKSFR
jgi:MFS family permease